MKDVKHRLEFLDFLRFIAAFAVLIQHGGEKVSPWFRDLSCNTFQFGVFGVTLFFLCSGFIIPVSLERHGSLKRFWTSRLFRLYPLYYVSILSALVLIQLGLLNLKFPSVETILWNLTMLMRILGKPSILGLYWTLSLEMTFYILVSLLFVAKLLHKTVAISIFTLAFSFIFGVIGPMYFHTSGKGWGTAFYIATMFTGTVFFKHNEGKVSSKTLLLVLLLAITVLLANTATNLLGRVNKPEDLGIFSFTPVTSALAAAYACFGLLYFVRHIHFHKYLLRLGEISYSLYLVQGLVFHTVPEFGDNVIITLLLWFTIIILISFCTYNLIEKPFIRMGKSIEKKFSLRSGEFTKASQVNVK
jgi:peptidoglycan/LPS O-acetylase OafA/YrhL